MAMVVAGGIPRSPFLMWPVMAACGRLRERLVTLHNPFMASSRVIRTRIGERSWHPFTSGFVCGWHA